MDVLAAPVQSPESKPSYTREEVGLHKKRDDCWIIIHGEVYNVTPWLKRHPGGEKVLLHYAGEDATVGRFYQLTAFYLFIIFMRAHVLRRWLSRASTIISRTFDGIWYLSTSATSLPNKRR